MEEKKEEPIVDDAVEKLKIKKPKKKKFKETSEPVKVDLKELKDKHSDALDSEHVRYNNLADAARLDYEKEVAPEMPNELTVILNGHRYNVL